MEIHSAYETMGVGASMIPDLINVKLLLRHSYRPTLKGVVNPDVVGLTEKGLREAKILGHQISRSIGACYSSPIRRCVETVNAFLPEEYNSSIQISDILGYLFVEDKSMAELMFKKINLKQIAYLIGTTRKLNGFNTKEYAVKKVLDLLFSTGNTPNTLDIYCTHDLQLAVLDLFMFSQYSSIDELTYYWPNMLEGMWFWGTRADFYCVWRGELKRFVDLLCI